MEFYPGFAISSRADDMDFEYGDDVFIRKRSSERWNQFVLRFRIRPAMDLLSLTVL